MRLALLVLVLLASCRSRESGPPVDSTLELSSAEVKQGREACAAYVKRVCACPALANECEDARSQPKGLEMVLEVLAGKGLDAKDAADLPNARPRKNAALSKTEKREMVSAARKVVAACVSADARLDPATCPR
jgi:hypothetical protein